tara:strand:+ start:89 stop:259 length:171 start_codon:yes stop_codon:yes gene_type:complete
VKKFILFSDHVITALVFIPTSVVTVEIDLPSTLEIIDINPLPPEPSLLKFKNSFTL